MFKKFFVSFILVCLLSCCSYADIVYTTENGTMGLIEIANITLSTDEPVEMYSGFDPDSLPAHFYNEDGTSFIALIEPETDTEASSGDKALIFNVSDLTKPVYDKAKILTGVYCANSAAYSDNHRGLFLSSNRNLLNGALISEFDTSDLTFVRSYKYDKDDKDLELASDAFINGILVSDSSVYGLISHATSQDSMLLRFDGQLKDDISGYTKVKVKHDAELIAFANDYRVILGHSNGVDGMLGGEFILLASSDYPVKALCRDAGNGFYFITESPSGMQTLNHYTDTGVTELDSGLIKASACQAVYFGNDDKKFLAVIMQNKIMIYNALDDSLAAEFDSRELGGTPAYITSVTQNTSSSKDSGKSGCDITGSGILLILCAGYMMIRKRKL